MVDISMDRLPPIRPEFVVRPDGVTRLGEIERPLSAWERLTNIDAARRVFILVVLAAIWEGYARYIDLPLMFPTFTQTIAAFYEAIVSGELPARVWTSVGILLTGYAIGIGLAAAFTTLAVSTRIGTDLLSTLTSMFNPLPGTALLPLSLLWFGIGNTSLVFVIVHSVLWAVALNTHSGFLAVSETLRMTGMNCGLRGLRYVVSILIPAAVPSILAGLKISWAFGWRTLVGAELVFGVSSGSGGLGWFIYEYRNLLETAHVFAGLFMVILIGLVVESVVFRTIETHTVRKWGMQR